MEDSRQFSEVLQILHDKANNSIDNLMVHFLSLPLSLIDNPPSPEMWDQVKTFKATIPTLAATNGSTIAIHHLVTMNQVWVTKQQMTVATKDTIHSMEKRIH